MVAWRGWALKVWRRRPATMRWARSEFYRLLAGVANPADNAALR